MSDEKQPMPAQPATKEISAPTQESILLAELRVGLRQLNARFDEVDGRLDSLETTQKILLDDGKSTRDRLVRVELRQDEMQDWRLRSSERVKNVDEKTSKADLSQAAALAEEKVAREALAKAHEETAKKVDTIAKESAANLALTTSIADNVNKFVASPKVKLIVGVLFALITGWAAGKGIHVP